MTRQKLLADRSIGKYIFLLLSLLLCLCFAGSARAASFTKEIAEVSGGSFVKEGSEWRYRQQDGTYAGNGLLKIDGKIYYFSRSGYRLSGRRKLDGAYYYFGTKKEGFLYGKQWLHHKINTYYIQADGKITTGLAKIGKKTYYFDELGVRQSGWQEIQGKRYYFGTKEQGWMYRNEWAADGRHWCYLGENGTPLKGWQNISGKQYYFNKNGFRMTGKHQIKGIPYYFNKAGELDHSGADLRISSECAILIEAESGKILYDRNPDLRHANASTTKIMTCILALEHCKMKEIVKVSAYAADQEPTKLYMNKGDSFYMGDLLYSLMLPSHNDTAVAIAEHIGGSTEKFVQMMNEKAREIGCTSTHFATPNGLDQGLDHYTTVRDLSKIAQYAWKNPTFRKIVGRKKHVFQSRNGKEYKVYTTNALNGTLPGVCGMKTGFTRKAGQCFVGAIKAPNGKTYISVSLGAKYSYERWEDAETLLSYAYHQAA